MDNHLNQIFSKPLLDALHKKSEIIEVDKHTELLREGQYVKIVPIVLSGTIRVYIKHENKELLLYNIKPNESCIMSFSAVIENTPSKVYAVTEEKSVIMTIPILNINGLLKSYPELNTLFYKLYIERYADLIRTIESALFEKLDQRILEYLQTKSNLLNSTQINVTHKQIALDLGSSREVISRTLKKLENDNLIKLHNSLIEIL
jgi:CRP/FNR family transcriptional regulator